MKPTCWLVAALILFAPAAHAQTTPVTKRAVSGTTVQAKAQALRTSTTGSIIKEFFVAYGGDVFVIFKVRSDGNHTANWDTFFGGSPACSGTVLTANFQEFGCGSRIPAGGTITVRLLPNGQPSGICCARLQFDLVNVNAAAVATRD